MTDKPSKFVILGGGFGLYGYLPAVLNIFGGRILLPSRYKKRFDSRIELKSYSEHIDWFPSVEDALQESTGVVVALPPEVQTEILHDILRLDNIKNVVLEKPIATSPEAAFEVFNQLAASTKKYRVGYIFVYSNWYMSLSEVVARSTMQIKIVWEFQAHHLIHEIETWKRYHSLGGGVLRFYGIHLVAVLARLGFCKTLKSRLSGMINNQPTCWSAKFNDDDLPEVDVFVSAVSCKPNFMITCTNEHGDTRLVYSAASPLPLVNQQGVQDPRVTSLESLVQSFHDDDLAYDNFYLAAIRLWQDSERVAQVF